MQGGLLLVLLQDTKHKIMSSNRLMDPIGKLMGLRYKSHPWHGVEIGEDAPEIITCFIEWCLQIQ